MEEALGSLAVPVTFLRAAWFMENAAWDVASAKDGHIQSYLRQSARKGSISLNQAIATLVSHS